MSLQEEFDKQLSETEKELFRKSEAAYYIGYSRFLEQRIKGGVTPGVAKKIIKARDAFIEEDYQEAYHQIYSIASPDFDKNFDDVWKELEELAEGGE